MLLQLCKDESHQMTDITDRWKWNVYESWFESEIWMIGLDGEPRTFMEIVIQKIKNFVLSLLSVIDNLVTFIIAKITNY